MKLDLTQDHYGYFFISYFTGSPQIRVHAEAQAAGQMDLCVLARSEKDPEALKVDGKRQALRRWLQRLFELHGPEGSRRQEGREPSLPHDL